MRSKRMTFALAVLFLAGTFTVMPVYAQADPDAETVSEDNALETASEENTTETLPEENAPEPEPITPEGNMTLVDDITTDPEDTSKQFLTVTSRDGSYFYIIIDRDASGNDTVHFLNQVDVADLLSLMDEEDVKAYQAALDAEDSGEKTKISIVPEDGKTVAGEPTESDGQETEVTEGKGQSRSALAAGLVILCLMAAVGGVFWYSTHKEKKRRAEVKEDPDADYSEDEEYELSDARDAHGESVEGAQESDPGDRASDRPGDEQ